MSPHRPRILVVHPKVKYMNPTTELWPRLFEAIGRVTFFGPGYLPDSVLARGLASFLSAQPTQFDLVVVSEHVTNPKGEGGDLDRSRFLARNYGYRTSVARAFLEQKGEWLRTLASLDLPTIWTFFEFDPYRTYPEWTKRVYTSSAYILGWGPEFVRPLRDLPCLNRESFTTRATDDWYTLLNSNPQRVMSFPAFVSSQEFHYARLKDRRWDWSVLGTAYADRRDARAVLQRIGSPDAGRWQSMTVAVLDRMTHGRIGNPMLRSWSRGSFQFVLRQSRASFTCGSALQYPVRKFFEIPAAGALLVAPPFDGLKHLGFSSKKNFIAAQPADIPQITEELLHQDMCEAQHIASSGQALVDHVHSQVARASQLKSFVEAILHTRFFGSEWRDGKLLLFTDSSGK